MAISRLTEDQRLAVDYDQPANLLLSAAAGSGKTTTITERIVERIASGAVAPAELLVITFTELAAKDLKVKISKKIRRRRDEAGTDAERQRLSQLANELDLAQISTIHSFCNQVLSSYLSDFCDEKGQAYLEPGYHILEGARERELLDQSIDKVLSDLYRQIDELNQNLDPESFAQPAPDAITRGEVSLAGWLTDFQTIALAYAPDLDDGPLRTAIITMLDQLRNLPDYKDLVVRALNGLYDRAVSFPCPGDPAVDRWWDLFEEALARARRTLEEIRISDYWSVGLRGSKLKGDGQLVEAIDELAAAVTRLADSEGRDAGRWDEIVETGRQMGSIKFPNFAASGKEPYTREVKNDFLRHCLSGFLPLVGLITDQIKRGSGRDAAYAEGYPSVFTSTSKEIREDLTRSARAVARFMEVVLLVDREFTRLRFSRNAIQFSDIEHGALKLLQEEAIRSDYTSRFREIYLDEYQDTSSIQEAIIQRIASGNLLMVGDIKQSIYRFRYANPSLFKSHQKDSCLIRRGQAIPELAPHQTGYLALLNHCFRSRPAIIGFINDFFSSFLTEESGEIDYDETQALCPVPERWAGEDQGPDPSPAAHVVLEIATGMKASPDDEPSSPSAREALMAVRLIRELQSQGVDYERIAILLPTNNHCRDYEAVLSFYDIPVTTRSGGVYPDNLVFRQVEALLQLLDNPRQDLPLISVLMGPFAVEPWTGEDLLETASLTLTDPPEHQGPASRRRPFFHDRFFQLAQRADHRLAERADRFLKRLEGWRFLASEFDFRQLLDHIFYETDYPDYIADSTFSESNTAALEELLDLASLPDPDRRPGIRAALAIMRELMEQGAAGAVSEAALLPGAVRVLTRHSSKGLEWDYVILGRLDTDWLGNRRDRPIVLLSETDGLSCATLQGKGETVINNPLHAAALLAEEGRERAEAWRLLYVAMTRAIHGLYLLFPIDKDSLEEKPVYAKLMETVRGHAEVSDRSDRRKPLLPDAFSGSLKNDAELILAYLTARFPDFAARVAVLTGREDGGPPIPSSVLPSFISSVRVTPGDRLRQLLDEGAKGPESEEAVHTETEEGMEADQILDTPLTLYQLITSELPFRSSAVTPAKVTVTELQRLGLERKLLPADGDEVMEPVWPLIPAATSSGLEKADMPLTMRTGMEDSWTRGPLLGTAMHTVFQFLDPSLLRGLPPEQADQVYQAVLEQLVKGRGLTEAQREAALPFADQAAQWAESDLAGRLIAAEREHGKVYREMPFTLAVASSQLDPSYPADEISLVQGMIDLWFVEGDQAVLIDFKTDRLTGELGDRVLRERYQIQIAFYAQAIERATGRPLKGKWIWLIREGRAVSMP